MKKIKIIQIALFTFALTGFMACAVKKGQERELTPSLKYVDTAFAFDYYYSEALKQKFMGEGGDALMYFEQSRRLNPKSDAANYQIAQILIGAGNFRNGKTYAKRAYELDKKNIWYASLLAGIYFQENKIDSAIYIYEKTVEFHPNNDELLIILANLYSENGNYENAIKIHQNIQQKYGINESITPAYIQNLIFSNKLDLAFEEVQEAIKLLPDKIMFYVQLAEIYEKTGERPKVIEVYKQFLEENPQNSQILIEVCEFLLNEERYNELLQILDLVILDTKIDKEEKIELFAKILVAPNFTKELIDQTISTLVVFESVYENDDLGLLLRPELLIKNNRKTEAIDRLEEIISKRPNNYLAWEKLLLLYYETKDFNKLFTRGKECASRFSFSFLVKLLYASGALANGHYDVALEELQKAAILASNNKEAIIQVYAMKADAFYRMNNFTEAFKTFEEALKVNPNDIIILNNYAYYLAEQNMELNKAEEMSWKVIEQDKDNATFLDTYAWVLFKQGKTKKAAKIMKQVISQDTNLVAEHYEHYGFILKKNRKRKKAIENWEMAIKLDSSKTYLKNEIENYRKRR